MRPLVGVTLNWYRNDREKTACYGRWLFGLNQSYAALLGKVKVLPLGIIPASEDFRSILGSLDMVVLTGGGDPDPQLYGQANNGSISCSRERPVWEMGFYKSAREMKVPVLGICLGMQLICMAEGGQLIQNIPTQVADPCRHHGTPQDPSSHEVEILEGTLLHALFGARIEVSSFHHQAIAQVPEGFNVAARSSDGVVEAIESEDGTVVAVQWHPERDFTGPLLLQKMVDRLNGKG